MADLSAPRRIALVASGLVLGLTLAACGSDDEATDPPATESAPTEATVTTETTEPAPGEAADPEAFCAEMERLDVETSEAYVGSDEHVADVDALIEVSPDEIRPAVERYRAFLASGQVTDDPDSKQTDGWPTDVQTDVGAIQDYATSHC